jgi:single-strand DNA-binding protein
MASDLNHVFLIGRLTRDADLKYTPNGQAVSKFSIAVNRKKKDGDAWTDEASFFDITLWGRQAEELNEYLLKGKQIAVDGELRQDRWQQDGQNRSKIEVIANSIQLLGGGSDSRSGTGSGNSYGNGNGQRSSQSQGTTRQNEDRFSR